MALVFPNCFAYLMIESGMDYAIIFLRLIFFPVARLKNCYVPCRLPVRLRTIAGVKQVTIILVGMGLL